MELKQNTGKGKCFCLLKTCVLSSCTVLSTWRSLSRLNRKENLISWTGGKKGSRTGKKSHPIQAEKFGGVQLGREMAPGSRQDR